MRVVEMEGSDLEEGSDWEEGSDLEEESHLEEEMSEEEGEMVEKEMVEGCEEVATRVEEEVKKAVVAALICN